MWGAIMSGYSIESSQMLRDELNTSITFNCESNPADDHECDDIQEARSVMESSGFTDVPLQLICGLSKQDVERMSFYNKLAYTCSGNEELCMKDYGYAMTRQLVETEGYLMKRITHDALNISAELIIKKGEVNIAFRGATDLSRWLSRLKGYMATDTFLLGKANSLYLDTFKAIWPLIRKEIDSYAWSVGEDPEGYKFNVTGHSVGGALAIIAGTYLFKVWRIKDIHISTFGAPRVFDHKQAQEYNRMLGSKTLCVSERISMISKIVASGIKDGYEHVGTHLMLEEVPSHLHTMGDYNIALQKLPAESFVASSDIRMTYNPQKIISAIKAWAEENVTAAVLVVRPVGAKN